jgi:hypothetical protein
MADSYNGGVCADGMQICHDGKSYAVMEFSHCCRCGNELCLTAKSCLGLPDCKKIVGSKVTVSIG